jgi:putative ABC transport system permease protein
MLQDIRFILRTLRKNSGFTCAAVLTLALGIGANTAIYSVIDNVLLHPIPFTEPDRLVALYQKNPRSDKNSIPYLNLLEWQKQSQTFEGIAGWRSDGFALTGQGAPENLMGLDVSENFFSVLRVQPILGRTFTKDEDRRGGGRVVLLGENFWKKRFAGDRNIVGRTLTLDGHEYTVIGVVPQTVRLTQGYNSFFNDVFAPIGQFELFDFYSHGTGNGTFGVGRLKARVSLAEAQAEMDTIMKRLASDFPDEVRQSAAQLFSYREDVIGNLKPILLALGAAVGFVLLIACTNVANLALARSTRRTDEFGIRVALGAGRKRIVRQLLTESVVLSFAGGAIGVLMASIVTDAALAALPSALPPLTQVQLNTRVLWFAFGLSLVTGIVFGLAPALKAAGLDVYETLKQGGRGTVRAHHRMQNVLIVTEIAFTLILLIGAGLVIRSLHKLWNVDPGFNPQGVLTFYMSLTPQRASSPEKIRESFHELNDRLAGVPGVETASLQIGGLPLMGSATISFQPDDEIDVKRPQEVRSSRFYGVGPDHFRTMGIKVLQGRTFTHHDNSTSPMVTVVDEELARITFPGQDPVGKRIIVDLFDDHRPIEIVGVVRHVKHSGLDSDATDKVRAQFYFAIDQVPDNVLPLAATAIACIVRSNSAPGPLLNSIRRELAQFESDRAIAAERTMTDAIADSLASRRFSLILLGGFAAIALALAAVGIYGVISYLVGQRTNEIGVRMALGARPRDIFISVLKEGGKLGTIGVAIGLLGAAALTRLMTSLLFATHPTDLLTYSSAAILLFALTLFACYIPARRALRIDPITALRHE